MTINITYDPPAGFNLTSPYYKTNTFVTLTCQVYGASGHITYKWSSTGPMSLAANSSSQTLTKVLSPDDTGNHMCTVQDVDGNIGSNTTQMHVKGEDLGKHFYLLAIIITLDLIVIYNVLDINELWCKSIGKIRSCMAYAISIIYVYSIYANLIKFT